MRDTDPPGFAGHIVNISGGKDSTATALIAADRGRDFVLAMADTGNEHDVTWETAHRLADFLGMPLRVAKADFSRQIEAKRRFVQTKWREQGVPERHIERALAVLQPTGNPFLDLCIWKGRFPSRKAQFCTEFLKQEAMRTDVILPALARGPVVQWVGVRRDESLNRRNLAMFNRVRWPEGRVAYCRPLIDWTAQEVIHFIKRRGAPLNPLYSRGMSRVGCFPCINANKAELRTIGRSFPEAVEKIAEWERIVADASKRGKATFFAPDVTPDGAAIGAAARARGGMTPAESASTHWPDAKQVFDWANTTRGGRQYDLLASADDGLSCSSQYGLCE